MYSYLLTLTIAATIGLQGWRTLFNNFAVEMINLDGLHIGIIQSVRELPGFLAFFAVYLILLIREQKLSSLSILFMGFGIILTGYLPTFSGLLLTTFIMSLGFHFFETTNQSLTLQHFNQEQSPLVMGKQRSVMSLVCILVGTAIFLLSDVLVYKELLILLGLIVLSIGIWGLVNEPRKDSKNEKQIKKIILKKKYGLFYILTFLSGARRQIFMVFSVFLLVKNFGFSIQAVTVLFVVNNTINYFAAPLVAKAIKHYGERTVLMIEYSSLVVIFTAYAFCSNQWVIVVLYILDHITFNGAMAIRTYLQKIAPPSDIASSTAVSFTINHIAAVVLPVIGGYLWLLSYRIPFLLGACLAFLSLLCSLQIKTVTNCNEECNT